jgi:hypothetical protein
MGKPADEGSVELFVLFLDENHCGNPHLRAALLGANVSFESHLDHFAAGTEDTEWLPQIGKRGWCLLTTDKRIRKRPLEREAVRVNEVRMFYFANNEANGEQMGETLRRALPEMKRLAAEQSPPFTASISKAGEVKLRDTFSSKVL